MFGVNDVNKYLDTIYTPDFILRLDACIVDKGEITPLTIIRNNGSVFIKIDDR